MFPGACIPIPVTQTVLKIGLYNTLPGLGLVYTVFFIPFASWMLYGYFRAIPRELDEAALSCRLTMSGGPEATPSGCVLDMIRGFLLRFSCARMVKLADTLDSGSSARKGMEVQVLFRAFLSLT
jgi:hypothetical protein